MKTLAITVCAGAMSLLLAATSAPEPGFEGTWSLDGRRSTALPPGMEQRMTITEDGGSLQVKTFIVTDFGDRTQEDRYVFDEAGHDVQNPGLGAGKRTARLTGRHAFTSIDRLTGPNGETTIERAWSMTDDERELTIELTSSGFAGRTQTRRVFVRGESVAPPPPSASRLFPVDLSIPIAPSPFRQGGKVQLVYELVLRNFRAGDIEWKRLEVLDDAGRTLEAFEGAALAANLSRPGTPPSLEQPQRIGGGMVAVAYLWIEVDGPAPHALRHRASFSLPSASTGRERIVESQPTPIGAPCVAVGPPARGRGWVARWISNTSFHRRGLFPVDGQAQIAQRFAIDWNRYDDAGVEQSGDESDNATYSVYGQDVIAVADATVAKVIDGVVQNSPPNIAPGVGLDPDKALGNSVVLELPGKLFATYAHLQPGSIPVKAGQQVHRGQVVGRVGNSGNATGPHLHFHLATGPGLQGEGVPYVIDSFERIGAERPEGDKPAWQPEPRPTPLRAELPVEHAVVAFD